MLSKGSCYRGLGFLSRHVGLLLADKTPHHKAVPCSVISLSCPSVVTKYVFWDSPRSWGYKESSVLSDGQFSKEFRGSGSCSLQPRLSAQTQCRRQAESCLGSKNFLYYDWISMWLQFSGWLSAQVIFHFILRVFHL